MSEPIREYCGDSAYARIYEIWRTMTSQCRLENRCGINTKIYKEWQEFAGFYDWAIENGFGDMTTIRKIVRSGNYEPINCSFFKIHRSNRENDPLVRYKDEAMPLSEAADLSGIHHTILLERYRRGKRDEELFRPLW